jgi:hypothetical protein
VSRRLLLLNALLGAASLACAGFVVWELMAPWPAAPARPRPPAPAAAPAQASDEPARPPAAAYNVIAARNLFSSTRTETAPSLVAGALTAAKPNLHGIVLRDQTSIAYLEDPMTKRVAGYRVGDAIAGGTVQTISADRVIIARPDGAMDVRLRDPSKPRPAPPAVQPAGAPPGTATPPTIVAPGGVLQPGVVPRAPQTQLEPGAPGTMVGPFVLPGRRPSPSLGRPLPAPPLGGAQGRD